MTVYNTQLSKFALNCEHILRLPENGCKNCMSWCKLEYIGETSHRPLDECTEHDSNVLASLLQQPPTLSLFSLSKHAFLFLFSPSLARSLFHEARRARTLMYTDITPLSRASDNGVIFVRRALTVSGRGESGKRLVETTFEMCLSRTGISHMHTPSIAALAGGAGGGAYTLHTLQTSFRRAPEGIKPDIARTTITRCEI